MFQSPIGTQKTRTFEFEGSQLNQLFQSPIGTQKTKRLLKVQVCLNTSFNPL